MNEEIKKDRSRNYPKLTLADAIELAKKLYQKAGKAKISPEVAVGALGYSGLNGAALGALGTLTQYGLIDRERGKSVSVSPLAIKLIHPLNPEQEISSKRESALTPQVFKELYEQGFHKCDTDLIANHLIQNGFTPDGARKSASVFKENIELSKLGDDSIIKQDESKQDDVINVGDEGKGEPTPDTQRDFLAGGTGWTQPPANKKMLAQYSIPLGANEATITFTGQNLSAEDFDALADYVTIFKKQFERKQKTEALETPPQKPKFPEVPFVARRKNQYGETMVKIVGQPWLEKGEWLCQAEGGLLVPVKEIFPNFPNLDIN